MAAACIAPAKRLTTLHKEWRLCIATLDTVPGEGALSVSLTASVGAVWRLSDLVLAPIGAPLSSL